MVSVKARVANGRLLVDEATDLPEGTELELVAVMEHDDDGLDAHQRRELHRSPAQAAVDLRDGRVVDGDEVMRRLRPPG